MKVNEYHLLQGAKKATGLTVIIDVFRAFSLETCLFEQNVERLYPVGDINLAYALQKQHPDWIFIGERDGKKVEGFDYGNSPAEILKHDFTNKTVVHTTSAGTQGLQACSNATKVITGSLRNASAIAKYIQTTNQQEVSIVAMGWSGQRKTEEDELCLEYIVSILKGNPISDIQERANALKYSEGKKFFDPSQQEKFPQDDFFVCVDVDVDDFVIVVEEIDGMMQARKVNV